MQNKPIQTEDKREWALGNQSIPKLLLKMSMPAIVGMMVMSVYNLVDALFMGMIGTEALGAATVGFPYFMILTALGLMLGMGGASYQSRLLGEKKMDMAEKTVATVFISGAILGILTGAVTTPFSKNIAILFGANEALLESSTIYIRILSIGAVFPIISMCANNLLRGEGSAMESLIGMGIGSVINIVLDPILMFGFNMGVKGAALATIISQAMGMTILLSFYFRKKTLVKFKIKQFFPKKELYAEIMKVGGAVFIQQILVTIVMAITNKTAAAMGNPETGGALVAAIGVINRVSMMGYAVMMGFGQGLQPVIGYNYGAENYRRVRKAINFAFLVSLIYGSILALVSFLLPGQIAGIFSTQTAVLEPTTLGIRFLGFSWPITGFFFVTQTLFQALGRPKQAVTLATVRQFFTLLCLWLLPLFFGIPGLMGTLTASMLLTISVAVLLYIPYHRELRGIIAAQEKERVA